MELSHLFESGDNINRFLPGHSSLQCPQTAAPGAFLTVTNRPSHDEESHGVGLFCLKSLSLKISLL